MQKKKGHNNNLAYSNRQMNIVTINKIEEQKTLFNKPIIKNKYKLSEHQLTLLRLFYLNTDADITRNILFKWIKANMHRNTISNFLKSAEEKEFIEKRKIKKGILINTMIQYYKAPDTFRDGSVVPDVRATYYKITELGIEVFEANEITKTK